MLTVSPSFHSILCWTDSQSGSPCTPLAAPQQLFVKLINDLHLPNTVVLIAHPSRLEPSSALDTIWSFPPPSKAFFTWTARPQPLSAFLLIHFCWSLLNLPTSNHKNTLGLRSLLFITYSHSLGDLIQAYDWIIYKPITLKDVSISPVLIPPLNTYCTFNYLLDFITQMSNKYLKLKLPQTELLASNWFPTYCHHPAFSTKQPPQWLYC